MPCVKQERGEPLNQSGNSGIITGLRVGQARNLGSIRCRTKGFFLCYKASNLLLNMYRGIGISGQGVKLTVHFHPVSRLRIRGAIPSLLHTPSQDAQEHYFTDVHELQDSFKLASR